MKKIIALTIPFLVLFSVLVVATQSEARRVPGWKTELSDYIVRRRLPHETFKIGHVVEATQPWNFNAGMGKPASRGWPWRIDTLPFPPTELRCALVEKIRRPALDGEEAPTQQVIYVGYHTDTLWRVGWLVHEGPTSPFTAAHLVDLDTIGCNLDLEMK